MAGAVLASQVLLLTLVQANFKAIIEFNLQSTHRQDAVRALRTIEDAVQRNLPLADVDLPVGVHIHPVDQEVESLPSSPSDRALTALLRERARLDQGTQLSVRFVSFQEFLERELPAEGLSSSAPLPIGLIYCVLEVEPGTRTAFSVQSTPRIFPSSPVLLTFLILSVLFVAAVAFLIALRLAQPLRALADAAQRLTDDQHHAALRVFGPADVRRVQVAFNAMGARLQGIVSSQQALLAAIGHDLRTPLTALKVRAELLADAGERERITRALDELERLTEAALKAAAGASAGEPFQRVDLAGLVSAVCDDLADLGMAVTFEYPPVSPIVTGWPDELARAVRNIVENAVRYGGGADVRLTGDSDVARIVIADSGPGIPEADLERVFEPLVRLEGSRNLKTGGHGLGLHIARNTILSHRGTVHLRNRAGGGLEATISLPREAGRD
jgi:signal transduction histidine kinase